MIKNKVLSDKQKINNISIINFKAALVIICISLLFTSVLSLKGFFFQNLIDDKNVAKVDIVAEKTIEVTDTYKTDQRRKELAQKLDPVMRPADDMVIMQSFDDMVSSIARIRISEDSKENKMEDILQIYDLGNVVREQALASFLLDSSDENFRNFTKTARHNLRKILAFGLSDNELKNGNYAPIILSLSNSEISLNEAKIMSSFFEPIISSNIILDEIATERAKQNVMDSVVPSRVIFEKGENIITKGQKVTQIQKDALVQSGYNILRLNYLGVLGVFLLVVTGVFAIYAYLAKFEKHFLNRKHCTVIITLTLLLMLIAIMIPSSWSIYLLPIPVYVLLLAIFTKPRTAFFITTIITLLIASALWLAAARIAVFILISLFTIIFASKIKFTKRIELISVGFKISICMIVCNCAVFLLQICLTDISLSWAIHDIIIGVLNCLMTGIFALGLLPILENLSSLITPYGLSELGDTNQPLLKRLQIEAPGTFSHSLMLSTLAERAAEAIGGNTVLARVGALYHDVGKLKRPLFFIENQNYFGIKNPHCKLNPRLSKMVIISHVKDGLEIAREYNIPDEIQDFIAQHHGTSLATYFYTQALKQEGIENVQQEQFRYPGPRPQTKEVAILMICDAVESASRTLSEYSKEELESLTNKIIVERLNDGQLSESNLSLKELKIIAETLCNTLRAVHHQRIKYHDNIIDELEHRENKKVVPDDKIIPEQVSPDKNDEKNG